MTEKHSLMGGKVHVYRRDNSGKWQCSTFLEGKNHRVTTGTDSLSLAKEFAEDWYFSLRVKQKDGKLKREKTFRDAAEQFEKEFDLITGGTRNRKYVESSSGRLRKYLVPFFGDLGLSEVTTGKIQEFRILRQTPVDGKLPARSTLHQEIVTLRQTLKTAVQHGWLAHLPDLSAPYKGSTKITHRGGSHPMIINAFTKRPALAWKSTRASDGSARRRNCTTTF